MYKGVIVKKNSNHGADAFNAYYAGIFGDRWEHLKAALLEPANPVSLQIDESKAPYYMDKASIIAASSLPLDGAESVLDMCAAPGGKTLVLAGLMPDECHLLANDRSGDRVNRLKKVLDDSLDNGIRARIDVCCKDAAAMCRVNNECFDRILLDAPCSSERHVLTSPQHLDIWSPNRVKTLAMTQWSLLSSAFRMLKPGGYLIYSTCALSSSENDQVAAKLASKFDNAEYVRDFDYDRRILQYMSDNNMPVGEKTQYGYHILPDCADGCGPLYYCLIRKSPM
ncbi:MAG: RsmB/NOP family class I SAM-dependent RNA methyltransferase [Spirochaetales bacterium]|nr:RsmB/NOP family class I SAM-dependent RNA methyltransferase [Spirochaetales bacterium]